MPRPRYTANAFTDSVRKEQEHYYGEAQRVPNSAPTQDQLTEDETAFIAARDSFYMATISETGWPYIQHRGGKPGFLHVVRPTQLAFADYRGNRQMLSTGNLSVNDRVALFLMDYPHKERLKIIGNARVEDARGHPELVTRFAEAETERLVERIFFIDVVSYDWNCPQHITPRYTLAEIEAYAAPLKQRIAELEAQLKSQTASP
jgi:predicted pyridoxine 5'-phosphate oxidase superfamily flavin-nucleotide-binding protein